MVEILKRKHAPNLAYVYNEGIPDMPPVVFLGGFRSDMQGTKALHLEEQCFRHNQTYVRFDYMGHGQSEGRFENGCISDWVQDAYDILQFCVKSPAILVGSSMGGWISLLLAVRHPKHVRAIIGLAAAPDFTTWMEEKMSTKQKELLETHGQFELENDYDDLPYIITRRLIEDGDKNLILDKEIDIQVPVRLIQGKKDADVPWEIAEQISKKIKGQDKKIIYIDQADHRLSSPDQLKILGKTLSELNDIVAY